MTQPSLKKARLVASNKFPARSSISSFPNRMNQLKYTRYQRLNEQAIEVITDISRKNSHGNSSTIDTTLPLSQIGSIDFLRRTSNEYVRVAQSIDAAFDSTTRYSGKVIGMGNNEASQLIPHTIEDGDIVDDNENNSNTVPTFISLLKTKIRAVSAGGLHSMALSTNGIPYTWGNSDKGALGRVKREGTTGSTSVVELDEGLPTAITGFHTTHPNHPNNTCEDGMIHQIAAGESHSLFLSIDGNVYQCGAYIDAESNEFSDDDSFKVVGGGDTKKKKGVIGFNQKPVHVYQLPKKAIAISAGSGYNAAILEDDTLVTWGMSVHGELGRTLDGKFNDDASYMVTVTDGKGKTSNVPKTTGIIEQHYLLPKPVMFAHNPPTPQKVIAVACGLYHLLAVAREPQSPHGKLYTSGLNNWGQLGHGDRDNRQTLTLVDAKKDDNFAHVAAGEHFSLALTHDRSVLYSFGRADYGQLGIGLVSAKSDDFFPLPQVVRFPKVVAISSIDAGDRHASALTTDRELYTWGFNEEGATGHQRTGIPIEGLSDMYRPTLLTLNVETECHPVQFSGGGQHSLLLVRPNLTE